MTRNGPRKLTSLVGLDDIRRSSEANIDISIRALDEHYELADRIKRCVALLVEHLDSGVVDAERPVSRMQFILVIYKQSVLAFLDILRGHVTEAYANLRTMTEAALFAALVEKEPGRLRIWIKAGDIEDRASYDAFKKEFSTGNAKRLGNHRVAKLLKKYDFLAKHTHASIFHLARSLTIARPPADVEEFQLQFFEFKIDEPADLRRNWLFAVEANIEVLELFESWLPSAARDTLWKDVFKSLKSEFEIAKAVWQPE